MQFRIIEEKPSYSLFYPEYRHKFLPFWFRFYRSHHGRFYQIKFDNLTNAKNYIDEYCENKLKPQRIIHRL